MTGAGARAVEALLAAYELLDLELIDLLTARSFFLFSFFFLSPSASGGKKEEKIFSLFYFYENDHLQTLVNSNYIFRN